jgi:hypothetical protein
VIAATARCSASQADRNHQLWAALGASAAVCSTSLTSQSIAPSACSRRACSALLLTDGCGRILKSVDSSSQIH